MRPTETEESTAATDASPQPPGKPAAAEGDETARPLTTSKDTANARRHSRFRLLLILGLIAIAGVVGLGYLRYADQFVRTEDAFVSGHQAQVGAEVGGTIQTVPWQNNQTVPKGAILFTLDPTPYQAAVAAAEANLAAARRTQDTLSAAIVTAKAAVEQAQASAQQAEDHLARLQRIKVQQFVSAQDLTDARAAVAVAQAGVNQAQAALDQARANLGKPGQENDRIRAAEAQLATARYQLSRTTITAPWSGRLASYTLQPGQAVAPAQPLFTLVATEGLWIDANFKEAELGRIQIGMPVSIQSDVYPQTKFTGKVVSIGAGAGTAFSLLPPQNATGNWVKVTQRVPVRIAFDPPDQNRQSPLPIGTSATVSIQRTPHPIGLFRSILSVVGLSSRPQ
ncbi:efflux RND transporter periplasmic adaptor subunit [Halothiobacillus sp. DCM-1]|uniref:efflux RND transporter periplasmic adaptor subunit n=1 Tax=Halothiobacillus sp. DCM-1 TaxID=3112558 RepID=UPI00324B8311